MKKIVKLKEDATAKKRVIDSKIKAYKEEIKMLQGKIQDLEADKSSIQESKSNRDALKLKAFINREVQLALNEAKKKK